MDTKVMVVGSAKGVQKRRPRIRLIGFWLNEIGFEYNSLATAEYEKGSIIIRLQGTGLEAYGKVVKQALGSKTGLLQVRLDSHNKKRTPCLEVKGNWLEKSGFAIGGVIVVRFGYGVINIRLVDPDKL